MHRPRPCRICRRWFRPDVRAGDRQHVCSDPACQRERHRRACADWHRRHRDDDRSDRLRARLVADLDATSPVFQADPLRGLDWSAARDAVGLEPAVLIEESGRLLVRWARDAVATQLLAITGESRRLPRIGPRDGIATGPRPG